MKISEKQLIILLRVLEGSLLVHDRTDLNIFGYDAKTRKDLYNTIVNQQPDDINTLNEE